MSPEYKNTVALLLEITPTVFAGGEFALKGGTALNLFVRDMPRLSVDIDLVFPRHDLPREEALKQISGGLARVKEKLEKAGLQVTQGGSPDVEPQLQITRGSITVKVEANFVFRGTVLPCVEKPLVKVAQDEFKAELSVLSLEADELYGSKLVAAFDRQHPRDLFDVAELLSHGGISDQIRQCFVVYLAGHNRPVHEVLGARPKDIQQEFENNFAGMTAEGVRLEDLQAVREELFASLPAALTEDERAFLLSLVKAEPQWARLPFAHTRELPALQWKLMNLQKLRKLNAKKFAQQETLLREVLEKVR